MHWSTQVVCHTPLPSSFQCSCRLYHLCLWNPGMHHSLALSSNGRVFIWGKQPGCTTSSDSAGGSGAAAAERVDGGGGEGMQEDGRVQRPHLSGGMMCMAGPGTEAPEAVTMVVAGGCHSLALTASGVVLAWGSNLQVSGYGRERTPWYRIAVTDRACIGLAYQLRFICMCCKTPSINVGV